MADFLNNMNKYNLIMHCIPKRIKILIFNFRVAINKKILMSDNRWHCQKIKLTQNLE